MSARRGPLDAEGFAAAVAARGPLLGMDPGTKTLGLAISDDRRSLASPLETIERAKLSRDLARLREIVDERGVAGSVVGMPVNMDGTPGPRAQSVRALIRELEKALALPVLPWDERMSTAAVERGMLDADLTRATRAGLVDKLAAAYILQGALDRLANMGAAG